ncbi:MAG: hypothetical protein ACYTGQ_00070 [Planctomycetota bacterium]
MANAEAFSARQWEVIEIPLQVEGDLDNPFDVSLSGEFNGPGRGGFLVKSPLGVRGSRLEPSLCSRGVGESYQLLLSALAVRQD